jgi:hypothetical protein
MNPGAGKGGARPPRPEAAHPGLPVLPVSHTSVASTDAAWTRTGWTAAAGADSRTTPYRSVADPDLAHIS